MANEENNKKDHESGFFVTAIIKREYFARAIVLILGLVIVSLGIVYFLVWRLSPIILPSVEDFTFSADDKGHAIRITLRGKSLSVINVPAYQFWTRTGVVLEKKNSITIKATGLVSTSAHSPMSDDKNISEIEERIIAIESDRDIHAGWRNADGNPTHKVESKSDAKVCKGEMAKRSDSHRLEVMPGANYGTLLAFVIPKELINSNLGKLEIADLLDTSTVGSRKVEILRIGGNAEIKYDNANNAFVVTSSASVGTKQSISAQYYESGELYLTINDTVVNNESEMQYPKDCGDVSAIEKANRKRQIELYKKMHNPKDIWYLDNRGSFLVTVEKEPADKKN